MAPGFGKANKFRFVAGNFERRKNSRIGEESGSFLQRRRLKTEIPHGETHMKKTAVRELGKRT